jgi:phage-related protein
VILVSLMVQEAFTKPTNLTDNGPKTRPFGTGVEDAPNAGAPTLTSTERLRPVGIATRNALTQGIIIDTHDTMPDSRKRLPASFYELPNGRAPVRDWLLDMDDEDRRTIGKDIAKAEFGWPIGMPSCRAMGAGLFEIRSNLKDGKIGRVLFGLGGGRMVLLHGLIKKTQATPKSDLDLARKRLKEVD